VAPASASVSGLFHGMQPLETAAAESLFGREQDVAQLVRDMAERPMTAIVGSSGIGKTSLVQAGLIARLERNQPGRWQAIYLRLGADPELDAFQGLAAVLAPLCRPAGDGAHRGSVRQLAKELKSGFVSL